jgi:hypothetical protein
MYVRRLDDDDFLFPGDSQKVDGTLEEECLEEGHFVGFQVGRMIRWRKPFGVLIGALVGAINSGKTLSS